jgi:carboxymethylenebutenolidase
MKAAMNPAPLDANDKRIVGCIVYYGMPEMDQTKLALLHCPILGIFGKKDQWISPKVVGDFESAMKKAKKKLTIHSYDADHAFANPSNPGFDKEATEDAMEHTKKFLKKVFGL